MKKYINKTIIATFALSLLLCAPAFGMKTKVRSLKLGKLYKTLLEAIQKDIKEISKKHMQNKLLFISKKKPQLNDIIIRTVLYQKEEE